MSSALFFDISPALHHACTMPAPCLHHACTYGDEIPVSRRIDRDASSVIFVFEEREDAADCEYFPGESFERHGESLSAGVRTSAETPEGFVADVRAECYDDVVLVQRVPAESVCSIGRIGCPVHATVWGC